MAGVNEYGATVTLTGELEGAEVTVVGQDSYTDAGPTQEEDAPTSDLDTGE